MATGAKPALAPHLALSPQHHLEYDLHGIRISIRPFTEEWISQVKAFNKRMVAGGLEIRLAFPEDPSIDYPQIPGAPVWQEPYLAVEDGVMRGGYYITKERYLVGGTLDHAAHFRLPISEVLINKRYKGLGQLLLADARKRQPYLYCTGYGGALSAVGKRLHADGWSEVITPFWFLVVHPAVFLRQIAALRRTPLRRFACDIGAGTGAGWMAIKTLQALRGMRGQTQGTYFSKAVEEFGLWADEIWQANATQFLYAAVRDRATLNLRYAGPNSRFGRIMVTHDRQVVGWAVVLDTQMKGNAYFGNMRVGTIVDCLAMPGHELAVVRAGARHLQAAGVDVIVSNQSYAAWCDAFRNAGFLSGPSNLPLAVSPELAERLQPLAANRPRFHVNRADGAGTARL